MGREIGFDVYAKGQDDSGGKYLQRLELINDDNWVCGRSEITDGWGRYFDCNSMTDEYTSPVFVKDFDGWKCDGYSNRRFSASGNGPTRLAFVPYEEFTAAAKEEALECLKSRDKRKSGKTEALKTLKELYCTTMCTYLTLKDDDAKKACEKQMDKVLKKIESFDADDGDGGNDYFEDQAEAVLKLIDDMDKFMSVGLVVIPFFSE